MEIGIHPIHMGVDTIYAVRGEGVILIDGGDPHKLANFKKGIEEVSIRPEEIQLIVLTHGHWDHIGSTKEIKELTGAKLLLHQGDMNLLVEASPSLPSGFTGWGKIISALLRLYSPFIRIPTFEVDIVAGDDEIPLLNMAFQARLSPHLGTPGARLASCLKAGRHL